MLRRLSRGAYSVASDVYSSQRWHLLTQFQFFTAPDDAKLEKVLAQTVTEHQVPCPYPSLVDEARLAHGGVGRPVLRHGAIESSCDVQAALLFPLPYLHVPSARLETKLGLPVSCWPRGLPLPRVRACSFGRCSPVHTPSRVCPWLVLPAQSAF